MKNRHNVELLKLLTELKLNESTLIVYRELSIRCFEGVFTVLKAGNLGLDSGFIGPPILFRGV